MVAGHEKFFAPVRRDEGSAFRIVDATSQKLQGEERVGGSAFPKIDLDCISLPWGGIVRAGNDEIQREAADHTSVSQELSDFCSVARDRARISWVGWKDAAEIALSGRTTKQLVVR